MSIKHDETLMLVNHKRVVLIKAAVTTLIIFISTFTFFFASSGCIAQSCRIFRM